MKPGIPWSVKGIGSDAREAAKDAARRRGMTLGAWLNSVILEQSEGIEEKYSPHGFEPSRTSGDEDTRARLDNLAQQLARLTRQDELETIGHYQDEPVHSSPSFTDILGRIDSAERETAEAFAAMNERLAGLGKEIARSTQPAAFMRPEDVPGYPALEGALRNIVDHIATSETRAHDSLKAMQERLAEIAARAEPVSNEAALRNSPTIARVEERLGELATRIARAEASARQEMPKATLDELAKLAERIEAVRVGAGSNAESRRINSELEGLNQRLDDLKADAASEHDLHSLRVALEQISARVAQGADLRPLADMEARLGEISKRLERTSTEAPGISPMMSELEARIGALDRKLGQIVAERGEVQAWPAIEPQLTALVDRLGQTEEQLAHLAKLDRSIGQLFESVEQSRGWARDVAEEAANRMADRLSQMQLGGAIAPSSELKALADGLDAMRASATSVDRRNQDTFAAIHDTLEQIVSRLSDLETGAGGHASPPLAVAGRQAMSNFAAESAIVPPLVAPAAFEPPRVPPLESFSPQLAKPQMPPLVTPLPDPLASPDLDPVPADDFIAAARRAAQAASQYSNGPFSSSMGFLGRAKKAKPATSPKSKWTLPFAKSKPPKLASPAEGPPAAEVLPAPPGPQSGKRRKLILVGLVLLAAASALAFGTYWRWQKAHTTTPPASQGELLPQTKPAPIPTLGTETAKPAGIKSVEAIAGMVDAMITAALPSPAEEDATQDTAKGHDLPAGIGTPSLRQAALDGNVFAQFVVAGRFYEGRGVEADPASAAEWYRKAAIQGLAPAQYRLGTLYERGKGVAQNLATARDWYERAAQAGNIKAMHNAAVLYAGAQAGTPGYQKAVRWFEMAAEHGLRDSQYNLAILYERGLGVEKNAAGALYWYMLAARQSDSDAAARAKILETRLPAESVALTKSRVDNFQAKSTDDSANRVIVKEADWQAPGPSASIEWPALSAMLTKMFD